MATLNVTSPWTGAVVDSLELDGPEAVEAKVKQAEKTAVQWRETTLAARIALVEQVIVLAEARSEEVAQAVTRQMGKPLSESRGEVGVFVKRAQMMVALAPDALSDTGVALGDGIRRTIVREPLGVVLDIAAWNYPLLIAVNVIVPAVLAGNTVLLKHASQTPAVGLWIEALFRDAGAPIGLVTNIVIRGRDCASLVRHRALGGVFFTGSVEAGRDVYRTVPQRESGFVDVGLELGGKDPAYVRADMPLDKVVSNLVEGAFYNAGQSCCGVERIYVDASIYDAFVAAYVLAAEPWVVGDPMAEGTLLGPVAAEDTLDTLEAQVKDAVGKGARLLLGGARLAGPGWKFPATVLADVDHSMTVMTEESFGPIIGIMPVKGDAEAIALMNDTDYGLTASIWTADAAVGEALARKTLAGTVFVNRCDYVDPALPWTGFRDTGKGITLSALGFESMTRARGLHIRPLSRM